MNVYKTPVGQILGSVTSVPAGINCGLLCTMESESYADGTVVTLTATAFFGASFQSWTMDCSGVSTSCMVTIDGDKFVVAHFALSRPSAGADTGSVASAGALRSRLTLSGGRGDVSVSGRTVSIGAGVETEIAANAAPGDYLVEGWVREGTGEGIWRFGFGSSAPSGRRVLTVLAGEPVSLTPDAVIFRVKGRLPQKVAFVVRPNAGEGDAPPAR